MHGRARRHAGDGLHADRHGHRHLRSARPGFGAHRCHLGRDPDRFRINSEYDDRVRRLREAEAAGGITAADRTRLETLALRERDEALRRIEGTTRRVASIPRPDREAEREINDIIRERERLIQNNENAQERYTRRLETLGRLVERSERIGQPIPDETISREANAALEELERSQQRVQQATERTSNTARELGLTFSSAFEDAIIKGESFSKVLQGILQDIARIVVAAPSPSRSARR